MNTKITILWSLLCVLVVCSLIATTATNFSGRTSGAGDTLVLDEMDVPEVADQKHEMNFIHINNNWTVANETEWCHGWGTLNNPYVIENVTINAQGGQYGILIQNSKDDYFVIRNCTIFNQTHSVFGGGIWLYESQNGTITNCTMYDCKWGMMTINADTHLIENNTIINCEWGIILLGGLFSFQYSININISGNKLYGCGIGIESSALELATYEINPLNTVNDKPLYFYFNRSYLKDTDFDKAGQIMLFYCNHSIISNLEISNASNGISLCYGINNTITNCDLTYHQFRGIYAKNEVNITIYENALGNNFAGIYLSRINEGNITLNTLLSCDRGIVFSDSHNNTILSNILLGSGFVIADESAPISSNIIDPSNTVNGKRVYLYENKEKLTSASFFNPGQIILINCNNSEISNFNIFAASEGIQLFYCRNISITDCNVDLNAANGMKIIQSQNLTLSENRADQCGNGFYFIFSSNIILTHSNASHNSESGFGLFGACENFTLSDLKATYNEGSGIMFCTENSTIENCTATDNLNGIDLHNADNNNITKILISNNIQNGIQADVDCKDNLFYNNTFVNNGLNNAYDEGSNDWNSTETGNDWDDYSGFDYTDDGFGDAPYNIPGGLNKDYKPLYWDAPLIAIYSPANFSLWGETAPSFFAVVLGVADRFWYSLNNSVETYNFTESMDQINQTEWDKFGNGTIIIHFYANDSRGLMANIYATLRKDIETPTISINSPLDTALFGIEAPNSTTCDVTCSDSSGIDEQWYMLINATNPSDHTENRTWNDRIEQEDWDLMDNGTIILRVFANDSAGNIGFDQVLLRKDVLGPNITIHTPEFNDLFSTVAPDFDDCDVEIEDGNGVDQSWHMLINATNSAYYTDNYTWEGRVNQTAWDQMNNGTIIIRIFANDSLGNIGFAEVIVRKDVITLTLSITSPSSEYIGGKNAPHFTLEISGSNLHNLSYMLINATNSAHYTANYTYSTQPESGTFQDTVLTSLWNQMGNGSIIIRFFLNKTTGEQIIKQIIIKKDITNPQIKIIQPFKGDEVDEDDRYFQIEITEGNVNTTWYRFYNGTYYTQNKTFTGLSGNFNRTFWEEILDLVEEGDNITIYFYCNDTAGNIGFASVNVTKKMYTQYIPMIPPVSGDDDDDDNAEFDFFAFLTSPLGLTIIGGSTGGAGVGATIFLKKRATKLKRIKEIDRIHKIRRGVYEND